MLYVFSIPSGESNMTMETLPLSSKNGHVPLPDWIAKQSNICRTMIWLGIGLYTENMYITVYIYNMYIYIHVVVFTNDMYIGMSYIYIHIFKTCMHACMHAYIHPYIHT